MALNQSGIQMKQFYINQKLFQDSVQKQLEESKVQSSTGIVIGKREGEKAYIYDIILTPNPEDTQPDIKQFKLNEIPVSQKNLLQLVSNKYQDFNYSDWLIEFSHSVQRLLTTGVEILGLFVYCANSDQKIQCFKKLNSIMNGLFTEYDEEDEGQEESKQTKTYKRTFFSQYILMSVYHQKMGQSIGDVNIFQSSNLNQISEQLRNQVIIDKLVKFDMRYPLNITIPFSESEISIKDFKSLNLQIQETLKSDLQRSLLSINKEIYHAQGQAEQVTIEGILDSFNNDDQLAINFGSQESKAKKGKGKQSQKEPLINLNEYQIPQVDIQQLKTIFKQKLSSNQKFEHTLSLKGSIHLSCYINSEKSSLQDVINLFKEDISTQFNYRLEIFDEEAQNNIAMVNPFDLNTDNMTRIAPFNLLMPRRVFFNIPEYHQGIKSKLIFNDYLLFFEKNEDAQRRIFESTGLIPQSGKLDSYENLDPSECEHKLLKNVSKASLNQKPKSSQPKQQDSQLKENKKEKTKEQLITERRQELELKKFKIRLMFFIISGVCMVLSYAYVYFYLM